MEPPRGGDHIGEGDGNNSEPNAGKDVEFRSAKETGDLQ